MNILKLQKITRLCREALSETKRVPDGNADGQRRRSDTNLLSGQLIVIATKIRSKVIPRKSTKLIVCATRGPTLMPVKKGLVTATFRRMTLAGMDCVTQSHIAHEHKEHPDTNKTLHLS